mmetsp:Transcript_31763/g.53575  ORF Transcript_31763/g.53575 Transcript_31763/m.53575 type:complete len:172 (-) Transcript_31763:387-902(-)|eukprot:CAMPEP_0174956348 /NCGR_PEP_ID=MMETSP0004_2-20121128/1479_1 /TAXON_ID=420556 /ORGANISM="Ochromonas sp., Strain CCMP1393" /LENGTH=171 /DNA_ID=CAMNT_0016204361 /DNA_START=95 /DNA_END=613 /DNA_ORIENTATION=+
MIGDTIANDLELANTDNEVSPVTMLLHGAEALIILFNPYTFGDETPNTMESLVLDINDRLDEFDSEDLRVVCITREPPSTNRHWISDKDIKMDVYSDCSLDVSNALVGTFDLSMYLLAKRGITLGTIFVSMPAVMIIGSNGKIISKYVASSPDTIQVNPDDILRMCGATYR